MKKALLCILILAGVAQSADKNVFLDLQLHYDFDRQINTSTLEFFQIDKLGNTFFFADFDFDDVGQHGAYFEITRNFLVIPTEKGNANLSVQYNDGVDKTVETYDKIVPSTFLYGIAFDNLRLGSAKFEFQTLVRKESAARTSWQLTFVWIALLQPWLGFTGYVDVNGDQTHGGRTRVQSEPQLKFLWNQWTFGSELEVSRNFLPAGTEWQPFEKDKWFAHPTIFLQYNF
jgi:hypothetical protein